MSSCRRRSFWLDDEDDDDDDLVAMKPRPASLPPRTTTTDPTVVVSCDTVPADSSVFPWWLVGPKNNEKLDGLDFLSGNRSTRRILFNHEYDVIALLYPEP